jgi:hypothetical protein
MFTRDINNIKLGMLSTRFIRNILENQMRNIKLTHCLDEKMLKFLLQ